jgi:hypothetical protein
MVYYKKNANIYISSKKSPFIKNDKFILPKYNKYDERELDLEMWLTFFGIWMAEGCMCGNNSQVSISAHKQRVKDAIDKACQVMNFTIKKEKAYYDDDSQTNAWRINNSQLGNYMVQFNVGAVNKSLPEWVWTLSQNQCRTLLTSMLLGDGHQIKNTSTRRYDTSSIQLASDVQKLALHAGYAANCVIKYDKGHVSTLKKKGREGETITSTTESYRLTIIETQVEPLVNKYKGKGIILDSIEKYNGKVYCCSVVEDSTNNSNGTLYVRRNGIPVWSCNSTHGLRKLPKSL